MLFYFPVYLRGLKRPERANKLGLKAAKLPPIIQNFKRVFAFSPFLINGKHFSFVYVKRTLVVSFYDTEYGCCYL